MNILLHKKKKVVTLLVFSVVFIGILIFGFKLNVFSATSSPEKFITDLSGTSRTTFAPDESAILTLRGYGEKIPGSYSRSSIVLALDISDSMNTDNKIANLKTSVNEFIDNIDTANDTRLGIVTYNETTADTPVSEIVKVTAANKATLKNAVNAITASGSTCMGCGVNKANLMFETEDATRSKIGILFSDGAENTPPWLNGSRFDDIDAADLNTSVVSSSALANAISKNINYYTIKFGDCGADIVPIESRDCPLMRFAAAKTNNINIPDEFSNWSHTYKQKIGGKTNGVDGEYFYQTASPTELTAIYKQIIDLIQAQVLSLNIYEKLASQADFVRVVSVKDRAGLSKSYTLTETSDHLLFHVNGINDTADNYVEIKLMVKMKSTGFFDIDSNYIDCESGAPRLISPVSKVDYLDGLKVVDSKLFPPLCIKVVRNSLQVVKTTYLDSAAGVDIKNLTQVQALTKTANFEAGNRVVVVLEIDELDASRSDFKINDLIPDKASGDINYAYNFSGGVAKNSATTKGSTTLVFYGDSTHTPSIGPLTKGKNYLIYRYKI